MLKIKINGAPASLFARSRPDEGWDVRCMDPLVGEFRLRSTDALQIWSEEAGEWLHASEMDLAELAVAEAQRNRRGIKAQSTFSHVTTDIPTFPSIGEGAGIVVRLTLLPSNVTFLTRSVPVQIWFQETST